MFRVVEVNFNSENSELG